MRSSSTAPHLYECSTCSALNLVLFKHVRQTPGRWDDRGWYTYEDVVPAWRTSDHFTVLQSREHATQDGRGNYVDGYTVPTIEARGGYRGPSDGVRAYIPSGITDVFRAQCGNLINGCEAVKFLGEDAPRFIPTDEPCNTHYFSKVVPIERHLAAAMEAASHIAGEEAAYDLLRRAWRERVYLPNWWRS